MNKKNLSYFEASKIAESYVSGLQARLGIEIVINHDLDEEVDIGFLFSHNSADAWKDPESSLALAGNGPLLILKRDGELVHLPTYMSLEEGLNEVRRELGLS